MDSDKVKLTSKLDFGGSLSPPFYLKSKARLLVGSDLQSKQCSKRVIGMAILQSRKTASSLPAKLD